MASRVSPITLDDAAPYRRLPQFAAQAPLTVSLTEVSPKRRILGLPARTAVLTHPSRRRSASFDSHQDAA
jgi:hypothetical protein